MICELIDLQLQFCRSVTGNFSLKSFQSYKTNFSILNTEIPFNCFREPIKVFLEITALDFIKPSYFIRWIRFNRRFRVCSLVALNLDKEISVAWMHTYYCGMKHTY